MRLYQYTGGADFVKLNACAVNIGSAADGSLYRIRSSGKVSHLLSDGDTWKSDDSTQGNGTPVNISVCRFRRERMAMWARPLQYLFVGPR
jgi:hypothetical protein